jgi:hypothetical protein
VPAFRSCSSCECLCCSGLAAAVPQVMRGLLHDELTVLDARVRGRPAIRQSTTSCNLAARDHTGTEQVWLMMLLSSHAGCCGCAGAPHHSTTSNCGRGTKVPGGCSGRRWRCFPRGRRDRTPRGGANRQRNSQPIAGGCSHQPCQPSDLTLYGSREHHPSCAERELGLLSRWLVLPLRAGDVA